MKRPLVRLLGLAAFGALASEAGHLIVFQIQFGAAAATVQSQGAHAYFPAFAKTTLGVAVALLLAGLITVGAARVISGRALRTTASPSFLPLLSTLFTIQMAVFITQELIEAAVANSPAPHAMALFFLGMVGQLPVAAVAALAIKWLAVRFESAVLSLRLELATSPFVDFAEVLALPRPVMVGSLALAQASPASLVKRGPPRYLTG